MDGRGIEKDLERAKFWLRKASEQGNKVAEYKIALCEYENVIVYLDADEYPNRYFSQNMRIMKECAKILDENYKVIYVRDDHAGDEEMSRVIYGSVYNMWPFIVLYKNGVEITRGENTFREETDAPKKLAIWIKEKLSCKTV